MTDTAERAELLNPFTWRQEAVAILADAAEQDVLAAQSRRDAEAAARLAAEGAEIEAARAAAESAVAAVSGAEPPDTIVVDTNGLSPGRARLCRFVAWVASLEAEFNALTEGRAAYLAAQSVPAMTEAAIRKLVADDKSGLLAMMGGTVSKHQLRSAERAKLAEKLANDRHAAEVAESAMVECDSRLDKLSVQIEALKARHKTFVADALAEAVAENAGDKLIARMKALHADALKVMGGAQALQTLRGVAVLAKRHDVVLPVPRLDTDKWITGSDDGPGHYSGASGYLISFELHQQLAEQRKWMALAERLLDDPRADIGDDA